jgi:predicted transcriptional regulator
MASVLQDMGFSRSVISDYENTGKLEVQQGYDEASIKRAYSGKIIQKAKDFGWTIKQQADGSYMLQKASF